MPWLKEALGAVKGLKKEFNDINLLNAKLLYTNKLFKSKTLNENQKLKVLSTFDKAANVNEVHLVYETMKTSLKSKSKTINESTVGSASKLQGNTRPNKPIIAVDDAFARMAELAFYDKKH